MQLTVAGARIAVTNNIAANVDAITRGLTYAAQARADFLLTPESTLSGYTHEVDQKAVQKALEHLTDLAQEKQVGLVLGTCFREPNVNKCYNQLRFYDPRGTYLGFHSKMLCCGDPYHPASGEINHYAVNLLQTFSWRNTRLAGLIGNDLWADPRVTPMPDTHLTRQCAKLGVKIIFHATHDHDCDDSWYDICRNYYESNIQLRAAADQLWIMTVNAADSEEQRATSPSGVVAPDGSWMCRNDEAGEQFFACTIDLQKQPAADTPMKKMQTVKE